MGRATGSSPARLDRRTTRRSPLSRSRRACEKCHYRKIRCDGTALGFPCTNCRLDRETCLAWTEGKFGKIGKSPLGHLKSFEKYDLVSAGSQAGMEQQENRFVSDILFNPRSETPDRLVPFYCCHFLEVPDLRALKAANISSLEFQDALRLPVQELMYEFAKHYFLYVHPCLPVVDESIFWKRYHSSSSVKDGYSILLVKAMLFAAAPFVPIAIAKKSGYDSVLIMRDNLYHSAKVLYESKVEKNSLSIAQASLLLTYYTSDIDTAANSTWLTIAVKHAKAYQAYQNGRPSPQRSREHFDLRRVWWCCVIRDRTISLALRRPIQILPEHFAINHLPLAADDLEDEVHGSEVYTFYEKIALSRVLTSLCQLAMALTELCLIAYPPLQALPTSISSLHIELNKVEQARGILLLWEADWKSGIEDEEFHQHSSVALFTRMNAMYYLTARIAACNRICLLLGINNTILQSNMDTIERCKAELTTVTGSAADIVKFLVLNEMADKPLVGFIAYTILPQVLINIQVELSSIRLEKYPDHKIRKAFVQLNHIYSARYHANRILNAAYGALRVFLSASQLDRSIGYSKLVPTIFGLRLPAYLRLLRYVDGSLSFSSTTLRDPLMPLMPTKISSSALSQPGSLLQGLHLSSREYTKGGLNTQGLGSVQSISSREFHELQASSSTDPQPNPLPSSSSMIDTHLEAPVATGDDVGSVFPGLDSFAQVERGYESKLLECLSLLGE